MQRLFGILIWPRIVTCWRSYSGVLRGLLKGITGQHPVCPKCCMILAGVTLKTAGGNLDWLCSTRLSLGMWPLIQIRLIWWLQTTGPEQMIDNKFRAMGASSTGMRYVFAVRTVSDWNQLPAVVVEQDNPAAFKAQLARYAPAACHDPPPPLA